MKKLCIFSFLIALIDQIIKIVISNTIILNMNIKVIDKFFYIANVHNDGAAFSILRGNIIFLILITLVALVAVYYIFIKDRKLNKFNIIILSMLIGGIIGNFIDRVFLGYVVDYLEFYIFNYSFPIFNFADICITSSIFILIINDIKEDLCKNLKSKRTQQE